MPDPVQPPASWYDLLHTPEAAHEAFGAFLEQWGTGTWFGAAIATVSGLLLVASRIPGVYGTLAGMAHKFLAPATNKRQQRKARVQAESTEKMILAVQDWRENIEEAVSDPTVRDTLAKVGIDTSGLVKSLTKRIDAYTPSEFNALVAEIKKAREEGKTDPHTYAPQSLDKIPKPIERKG